MPPHEIKKDILQKTACVYLLRNGKSKSTFIGVTSDLKACIRQHNRALRNTKSGKSSGRWVVVFAVTGFMSRKDALQFEDQMKETVKRREFDEYATLYQGRLPASVVKRILAARCLFCEQDRWWTNGGSRNKKHYVIHWGKAIKDPAQFARLKNNWGRIGRLVTHVDMSSYVLSGRDSEDEERRKKKKRKLEKEQNVSDPIPDSQVIVISSEDENGLDDKPPPPPSPSTPLPPPQMQQNLCRQTLGQNDEPPLSTSSSPSSKASYHSTGVNSEYADDEEYPNEDYDDMRSDTSDRTMIESEYEQ